MTFPSVPATLPGVGQTNTWTALQTFNTGGLAINGGSATAGIATVTSNGVVSSAAVSGDCTASGGAFTCLKTNNVSFGTFATQNYATPPAIGGTTPNAGLFNALTDTALSAAGLVSNTSGGVLGTVAYANAADIQAGTSATKPDAPSALLGAQAKQTITESANAATINWQSGFNARVVLNANLTTLTLSNPSDGLSYLLDVIQPATGGPYTATWPASVDCGGAGTPTLSTAANASDQVVLTYDSASSKYHATIAKGF